MRGSAVIDSPSSVKRVVVPFKLHASRAVVPRCDVSLDPFKNSDDPGVAAPQLNHDALALVVVAG